jgi:phytoene/squalene synthetase
VGLAESDVLEGHYSEKFFQVASAVAQRARTFYNQARQTLPLEDRSSMIAAELMGSVYWSLFRKLEKTRFHVFGPKPTRLSKMHKASLVFRLWIQSLSGGPLPRYGLP